MKQNKVTLVFGERTLDTFAEDVNNFYEFMTEIEDFVGTKKDLRDALKTKFASIGAFSAAILLARRNGKQEVAKNNQEDK